MKPPIPPEYPIIDTAHQSPLHQPHLKSYSYFLFLSSLTGIFVIRQILLNFSCFVWILDVILLACISSNQICAFFFYFKPGLTSFSACENYYSPFPPFSPSNLRSTHYFPGQQCSFVDFFFSFQPECGHIGGSFGLTMVPVLPGLQNQLLQVRKRLCHCFK